MLMGFLVFWRFFMPLEFPRFKLGGSDYTFKDTEPTKPDEKRTKLDEKVNQTANFKKDEKEIKLSSHRITSNSKEEIELKKDQKPAELEKLNKQKELISNTQTVWSRTNPTPTAQRNIEIGAARSRIDFEKKETKEESLITEQIKQDEPELEKKETKEESSITEQIKQDEPKAIGKKSILKKSKPGITQKSEKKNVRFVDDTFREILQNLERFRTVFINKNEIFQDLIDQRFGTDEKLDDAIAAFFKNNKEGTFAQLSEHLTSLQKKGEISLTSPAKITANLSNRRLDILRKSVEEAKLNYKDNIEEFFGNDKKTTDLLNKFFQDNPDATVQQLWKHINSQEA